MDNLVSTEWLASQIGTPGLNVFDATKYLPNEGRDGATEFRAAHIPGARFFDIDVVADPETTLPHMVPSPGRFERLMGEMGVGNDSAVVFYDQKGIASSARGWWLMGLFGHERAAVLDGGLPKWLRENRPVEAGEAKPAPASRYRASFRAERLRGIGDMMAAGEDGRIVLDARPAGRFAGTAPEPRPGLPSGHMPGSRSLPSSDLLRADGVMLPPAELRARFASIGVDGRAPVVTSCGTGVTATILTLGLVQAGLPPGAVYDGSWTEWASRPDTPKENTGAR
ncbi:MAG: sulfurtransferase [Acetobacteraceae bacterium]|nr:sulfurtransferase [Acetobacteraceae bacterium]